MPSQRFCILCKHGSFHRGTKKSRRKKNPNNSRQLVYHLIQSTSDYLFLISFYTILLLWPPITTDLLLRTPSVLCRSASVQIRGMCEAKKIGDDASLIDWGKEALNSLTGLIRWVSEAQLPEVNQSTHKHTHSLLSPLSQLTTILTNRKRNCVFTLSSCWRPLRVLRVRRVVIGWRKKLRHCKPSSSKSAPDSASSTKMKKNAEEEEDG